MDTGLGGYESAEKAIARAAVDENTTKEANLQTEELTNTQEEALESLGDQIHCPYGCTDVFSTEDGLQIHGIRNHPGKPITADCLSKGDMVN